MLGQRAPNNENIPTYGVLDDLQLMKVLEHALGHANIEIIQIVQPIIDYSKAYKYNKYYRKFIENGGSTESPLIYHTHDDNFEFAVKNPTKFEDLFG